MTRTRAVLPAQLPAPPPLLLLLLLLALLLLAVPRPASAAAVAAHGTCPERSIEPEPGVCCPASCGRCGGNDCHQLPGGSSACCPERIRAVNKPCGAPPCVLEPTESYGITMERYVGGLVRRFAALRKEAGHAATHMVLVGDSTMRGQSFKLCRALLMAAGDARRCPPKLAAAHDGLTIEYREAKIFDAGVTRADVIYFGHALHTLHLMPAKVQPMHHVAAWLRYEDALRATVEAYLKANDAPLIVFTLAHAVSTEGWDGGFLRALRSYEGGGGGGGSSSGHALCVKRFGEMAAGRWAAFSAADAQRYCREGMMTSVGTAALNVRARATIEGSFPARAVSIVDAFAITAQQTWATAPRDGRHYPDLEWMELASLLHKLIEAQLARTAAAAAAAAAAPAAP